jgi:cellobiose phosphorylase
VAYRGGPEQVFRRAESAAFFGREIGLMYVHAHLRYGEALAVLREADGLWQALEVVNPVSVTERLAHASPRQRNGYFSSSDAAFPDRYRASAEWQRVMAARSRSMAAGGSTPAGRVSIRTCFSLMPLASGGVSANAWSSRCCQARLDA